MQHPLRSGGGGGDTNFFGVCRDASPHNPHPPPKSLAVPARHVDEVVSAKRSMGKAKLLACLHTRLQELQEGDMAHRMHVATVNQKISDSQQRRRQLKGSSELQHPTPQHASPQRRLRQTPVSRCSPEPVEPQAGAGIAEQNQVIWELERRLQELGHQRSQAQRVWEEKKALLDSKMEHLREEVVGQVLGEREREVLQQKTRSYPRIPSWRQREESALESLERRAMEANDDCNMLRVPGPDRASDARPTQSVDHYETPLSRGLVPARRVVPYARPEGSVAVVMINAVGMENIATSHPDLSMRLRSYFRTTLEKTLADLGRTHSVFGYESVQQGFLSMLVFPDPVQAAIFASELISACHTRYAAAFPPRKPRGRKSKPPPDPILKTYPKELVVPVEEAVGAVDFAEIQTLLRRTNGALGAGGGVSGGGSFMGSLDAASIDLGSSGHRRSPSPSGDKRDPLLPQNVHTTLFQGPLLTIGVDCGDTTSRLDAATMKYVYRGKPVSYAAHATCQCRPGETLMTKHAFITMKKLHDAQESLRYQAAMDTFDSEEFMVGKEVFYSILPIHCGEFDTVDPTLQRNSGDDASFFDDQSVSDTTPSRSVSQILSIVRRKVTSFCQKLPPLRIWWEHTGVHKLPPYEHPFCPTWKAAKRGKFQTRHFEGIEYELMRANDISLRRAPPIGTVTLVFTDVQGSTNLWDKQTEAMKAALAIHNKVMRQNIERYQGYEVRTEGDAFMIAFEESRLALAWAVKVQRELMEQDWPESIMKEADASDTWDYSRETQRYVRLHHGVRVRVGFNVCEPDCQVDPTNGRMGYFGQTVHLASRISDVGRGGEITMGLAAYKILTRTDNLPDDIVVTPLGRQQLAGLSMPESLFLIFPKELSGRFQARPKKKPVPDVASAMASTWTALSKTPKTDGIPNLTDRHVEKLIKLDRILPKVSKNYATYHRKIESHETHIMSLYDTAGKAVPPTGTLAIAFSDIQGSTSLWDKNPDAMKTTIARHNRILRSVAAAHNGYEVKTEGDAFMVAFASVIDALNWCCNSQMELLHAKWHTWLRSQPDSEVFYKDGVKLFDGPRVRMGFNYGTPMVQNDPVSGRVDYFGPMVNLAARVSGYGRGGEIAMGFSAFTELSRLNTERNGAIFAPYEMQSKGEVNLKGVSVPEFLHLISPKPLAARWSYWKREVVAKGEKEGKDKDTGSFWASVASKLEAGKMPTHVADPSNNGTMIPVMMRDMLRRTSTMKDLSGDGKLAKSHYMQHGIRVLAFVLLVYRKLLMRNGILDLKKLRPLSLEDHEAVAQQVRPRYLTFQEERDEVDAEIQQRKRSLPMAGLKRPMDGYFNEKAAVQLIREFETIDDDRSGTIHMNEIINKGFNFSFLDEVFDEKLFKRFDKDRDGVISIMEVFRAFFPKSKVVSMQKWLQDFSQQPVPKESQYRRNSDVPTRPTYVQVLNSVS